MNTAHALHHAGSAPRSGRRSWRCTLALCLVLCASPAYPAPDWTRWESELAGLRQQSLPEEELRRLFLALQAQLPPDPPYAVQRELIRLLIQLSGDHAESRRLQESLRDLALRHGDRNTALLMRIDEIFDNHSDADIETSLRQLSEVRLQARGASAEVRDAMALAFAYMYWDVGNFELALRHLLQARDLVRESPVSDPAVAASRGENIARLYVDLQDPRKALEILDRVESRLPGRASPLLRAHMLATRAAAYRLEGREREAVRLLEPALAQAKPGDADNGTQRMREELAESLLTLGEPARAQVIADAMVAASANGAVYYRANGEVIGGEARAALGHVDQGMALMERGLDHFRHATHVVALQQGLGRKVDVLAAAGRYAQALATMREQRALTLRMYGINRAQGVASLQVEEDIARREREIRYLSEANSLQEAKLEQERMRNETWMIISVLAVGVVALLALSLYSGWQQRMALWKDALTGAFNRHYLPKWLKSKRERKGMRRAVALLDLDHFKAINDRYGHGAGDEVLRQAGLRLRATMGGPGELFRWGGEEFLLVRDLPAEADVEAWLRGLLKAFAAPVPVAGQELKVSASIGCVLVPPGADSGQEGLDGVARVADVGMYQAKAEGRSRAVWVVLSEAGNAAWPWAFTITADTLREWRANGCVEEVRAILPDLPS